MSNSKMFVPGAALDGLRLALEAENKKLRARVEELEFEITCQKWRIEDLKEALIDARHNGLIYWTPWTGRGVKSRAAMMARIDAILNKEAKP